MTDTVTHWHGTEADYYTLQEAVKRNCDCRLGEFTCSGHETIFGDQSVLDHMAFVGRRRAIIIASEDKA